MQYSVGEVSKKLGIPISTLHYYERQGLLPPIKRNDSGNRMFDERDLDILSYITCFKNAGMSIKQINKYFRLYEQGESKCNERVQLLQQQLELLERQLQELNQAKKVLIEKIKEAQRLDLK